MFSLKKMISYVVDLPVEKVQSQFSGEVQVALSEGQYKLSTQNAIYSFGKKYTSFSVAFKKIDINQQPIKTVLVLGFGLGSVVDLLEHHPTIELITAVDADAVIITLAKKYLQTSLKRNTNFVCSDAAAFVYDNTEKYDVVLFDVFIDNETPMPFMQKDFLLALKKCVNKNGILLFSKIDDSHISKIENQQFEAVFTSVFAESFSINTNGNKVFAWINN